jgi:hypothetical protein
MKELLNNKTTSIFDVYPDELKTILNDTYLDLSVKGFSNEFCTLMQYKYAKTYVDIVTKNTRLFGYDANGVEERYELKHMRKSFACNNIDIDKLLEDNNFEPYENDIRPQIFNLNICDDIIYGESINVLTDEHYTPLIANNYLIIFKI